MPAVNKLKFVFCLTENKSRSVTVQATNMTEAKLEAGREMDRRVGVSPENWQFEFKGIKVGGSPVLKPYTGE